MMKNIPICLHFFLWNTDISHIQLFQDPTMHQNMFNTYNGILIGLNFFYVLYMFLAGQGLW